MMRNIRLIILLVLPVLSSLAQVKPDIKAFATGKLFGDVIRVEITNNSTDDFTLALNPFYFPFVNKNQGYIIPQAHIFSVRGGERAQFYLQGYGTDMGKKLVEADAEIPWQIIEKLNKVRVLPYDSVIPLLPNYNIKTIDDAGLIPFDFIVTHPGTHDPLAYYFDIEQQYELTQSLLVNEVMRLENAYSRLKKAGKLVTHFNNDPQYERKVIMQMAVWITAAGLKGMAVKKTDLKKALYDFYKTAGGELSHPEFNKSYSRYHNILKTVGQEARVFIVPEDMGKAPACLPQVVGFQPTYKAVKTPSVATRRFETYPVVNQRFLNQNDCLPCKTRPAVAQFIKVFILKQQLNTQLEKIFTDAGSAILTQEQPEAYSLIQSIFAINPAEWLHPVNFDKKPESVIFQNYFKTKSSALEKMINADTEDPDAARLIAFFEKANRLSSLILLLYQNNNLVFSLDCCDNDHPITAGQLTLAGLLLDLAAEADYFESLRQTGQEPAIIKAYGTEAMVAVLSGMFTFQAHNRQYISVGESLPAGENAANFLEEFYKIHFPSTGSMQNGRYTLTADSNQNLIFVFDIYHCGKYRESTLPFLVKKAGVQKLADASHISKVTLDHKLELSAYFGQRWMSAPDASYFNGGSLTQINAQLKHFGFDTLFNNIYSPGYYFTKAGGFEFANVIDYSFSLGYEFFDNLYLRIDAGMSKGFVEGDLPVHYFSDPADTSVRTVTGLFVRSRFNAVYGGLGLRYYYGIKYKPFAGASFQVSRHSNNTAVLYSDFAEIQLLPSDKIMTSRVTLDLGMRYQVNQDFFIEAGGRLIERSTYTTSGFASDFSVFGGGGIRF